MYCVETYKDGDKIKHRSRFAGITERYNQHECLSCGVALCTNTYPKKTGPYTNLTCAERFHQVKKLPGSGRNNELTETGKYAIVTFDKRFHRFKQFK